LTSTAHSWRLEVGDVEAVVKHDATAGAAQPPGSVKPESTDAPDILPQVSSEPKRAHGGGFYCEMCPPDGRRVFADRPALWADHLFDPLREWVNINLAQAKWLALYGSPKRASWAPAAVER
jgi:hypothetical protein